MDWNDKYGSFPVTEEDLKDWTKMINIETFATLNNYITI
jgi:hypothetical protein